MLAVPPFKAAFWRLILKKETAADIVTVLIVEDDRAMRELIKKMIGDLADTFCERSDGRDALAASRRLICFAVTQFYGLPRRSDRLRPTFQHDTARFATVA